MRAAGTGSRAHTHTHTHTQRPQADHSHSSLFARGFAKRASPAMARAVCPVANSWQIRLGWARVGPPLGRARASPGAAQRKRTENMTKCGFYYGRFTIHRHLSSCRCSNEKKQIRMAQGQVRCEERGGDVLCWFEPVPRSAPAVPCTAAGRAPVLTCVCAGGHGANARRLFAARARGVLYDSM